MRDTTRTLDEEAADEYEAAFDFAVLRGPAVRLSSR